MIWAFPDLDRTGLAKDITWRHTFANTKWGCLWSVCDFMEITLLK
jgi:hypothetical protein